MVVTLKGWSSHSKTLQFECVAEKDFDNTAQKLTMIVVTIMENLRKTRKENLLQNQKRENNEISRWHFYSCTRGRPRVESVLNTTLWKFYFFPIKSLSLSLFVSSFFDTLLFVFYSKIQEEIFLFFKRTIICIYLENKTRLKLYLDCSNNRSDLSSFF